MKSLNNDTFCVYCHITPSGKIYAGISKDPIKRWNSGKGYAKNYLFSRAIQKYGWDNIGHIILEKDLSVKDAKNIERRMIETLKLTDPQYGYNLRSGGDGSFSEESRERMSKSRKGNSNSVGRVLSDDSRQKIASSLHEYYQHHPGTFTGRRHSDETITALRNRVISEETRQKLRDHHRDISGKNNPSARAIYQYDAFGKLIDQYDCVKYAADKYRIDSSEIVKCCRGKRKAYKGYIWKYQDANKLENIP